MLYIIGMVLICVSFMQMLSEWPSLWWPVICLGLGSLGFVMVAVHLKSDNGGK